MSKSVKLMKIFQRRCPIITGFKIQRATNQPLILVCCASNYPGFSSRFPRTDRSLWFPVHENLFLKRFLSVDSSKLSGTTRPTPENLGLKINVEQLEAERAEKYAKSRRNLKYTSWFMGFTLVSLGGSILYFCGSPSVDDIGNEIVDEFTGMPVMKQYFARSWQHCWSFIKSVPEPSRDKLLPDPLKEPYYQPKYTIVFEISGIMVHPEWTLKTGWRFKRRPAVEYFLKALGYPRSELVVYTSEQGMIAHPIIDSLDTENVIMYRLYRDTTKYKDGAHMKDLSKLNRDLSKVIYVDWDNKSFSLNPENALRIPKWDGEDDDTALVDLANLIRAIIDSNVDDVRPVVQYYSGFDNPLATFQEKQQTILNLENSKRAASQTSDQSLTKNWSGSLFGYRRH